MFISSTFLLCVYYIIETIMWKELVSSITKFASRDKIIILIALIVIGFILVRYSGSKSMVLDGMDTGYPVAEPAKERASSGSGAVPVAPAVQGAPAVASPSDLLPVDANSQWSALNPVGMNQGNVLMPDLLQAGYHIGLDTIGQTLRNPTYDLRSDPVIPKQDVGPWNQSTIEPDLARVPLELGCGSRY
jgi:hypothetical protein